MLFSSKKIRLDSPLSTEEVLNILKSVTLQREKNAGILKMFLTWPKENINFFGRVEENHFNISPIARNRNSFRPVIIGSVHSEAAQSRIDMKMSLHPLVIGFIIFWLGMMSLICLSILISLGAQVIKYDPEYNFMIIAPFLMLGFGLILAIIPFKITSNKTTKELKLLFKAVDSSHSS